MIYNTENLSILFIYISHEEGMNNLEISELAQDSTDSPHTVLVMSEVVEKVISEMSEAFTDEGECENATIVSNRQRVRKNKAVKIFLMVVITLLSLCMAGGVVGSRQQETSHASKVALQNASISDSNLTYFESLNVSVTSCPLCLRRNTTLV